MTHRITIIGSALSGNKGAASMLQAGLDGLTKRIPDAQFTLLSMYPDEDEAQNTYPNLQVVDARPLTLGVTINSLALFHALFPPLRPLLRKNDAIKALSESEVLLDQGGITFSDGREKFLVYNVASVLPALFMGVPVFKCAQAIGPFRGRINRLTARTFLPHMRHIVTRGRVTHDHVGQLRLDNCEAGADLAFTLDHVSGEGAPLDTIPKGEGALIGLSPSVVMQKKIEGAGGDYIGEMAEFGDYLISKGHRVLLIPHSVRTGTDNTHNNDLPLCQAVFDRLSDTTRRATGFLNRETDARNLRQLIARCDVFVTSRFHAMVSGLATATPTLVIGWSHKYEEVLEMFGAERWALAHTDYSQERLQERFEELFAERAEVAETLGRALPKVREVASVQLDRIAEIVTASC